MASSDRVDVTTSSTEASLDIPSSLRSDTGRYTLTLENNLGSVSASANVTVVDRPTAPEGPLMVGDVTKESCRLYAVLHFLKIYFLEISSVS